MVHIFVLYIWLQKITQKNTTSLACFQCVSILTIQFYVAIWAACHVWSWLDLHANDYLEYVIMAVCWLAPHCVFTLFLMWQKASLITYRGALNDYIFSTSGVHLHINLMHFCIKIWLQPNHRQEHTEFKVKQYFFYFFCKSQGLLLMRQSFSVACEIVGIERDLWGWRGEDERLATGERMRERQREGDYCSS